MEIRKPRVQSTRVGLSKKPVSKIAQKRVKKKKLKGIFILVAAILLMALAIIVARTEKLFITNISVSGVRPEYADGLREQTKAYLEFSQLLVLPNKNILLFPEKKLTKDLLKNNSYLESITFERRGLNSLDIQARERAPYFSVESANQTNLFVDVFGVIYSDPSAQVSTSTILLRETAVHYAASGTGALPVDIQNQKGGVLPEAYFKNLTRAIDLFKAKNFTIYSVTLRPFGDADLQITPEGGTLRINLYDDIDKTVATFSAARKIETLRSKLSEQRPTLRYIDLRFGNKVFYMFSSANNTVE